VKGQWITSPNADASVIFVHGVLSDGDSCWTNANGCYWPNLLTAESNLGPLGIYVFTYYTGFFSGSYSLSDIVDALKEHTKLDRVSDSRRLIFVCHSMGGIVVRKYIVERATELIERQKDIGLFLVASPSLGSSYADWLSPLARFLGHSQADVLRFVRNNVWLSDLDKEFKNLKESRRLRIEGKELVEDKFVVLKRFIRRQVVEPFSGAVLFGESFRVAKSDHFSIAKPADETAIQHRLLCDFIRSAGNWNQQSKASLNAALDPTASASRMDSESESTQPHEVLHPRDKVLVATSKWNPDGLEIKAGNIIITALETRALFNSWLSHLPDFIVQENPKSKDHSEALEKAFILSTLKAWYDVYKVMPDEEEMQRGSSVLSRKMNLFYAFARNEYLKAKRRGTDLKHFFSGQMLDERHPNLAERQQFLRTLLHNYVLRVCDVSLDQVSQFEELMRKFPPWEPLVERAYEINEQRILEMARTARLASPKIADRELADGMTAAIIELQNGFDDMPQDDGGER